MPCDSSSTSAAPAWTTPRMGTPIRSGWRLNTKNRHHHGWAPTRSSCATRAATFSLRFTRVATILVVWCAFVICFKLRSRLETAIHLGRDNVESEIKANCIFAIVVLTACCLIVVSCSDGESNVFKGNRDGIIHVGNGTEPQSLDPHVVTGTPEINIVKALFEGLVTIDPYSLQPRPGVAESWHFSNDQKQVTFKLNPQARWSNGDPVLAEDFVWSWRRALDPELVNLGSDVPKRKNVLIRPENR